MSIVQCLGCGPFSSAPLPTLTCRQTPLLTLQLKEALTARWERPSCEKRWAKDMRREWRGRSSLMEMQLRRQDRSTPLDCRKDGMMEEVRCARVYVCTYVRTCTCPHLKSGDGVAQFLQAQSEHRICAVRVTHYRRETQDHLAHTLMVSVIQHNKTTSLIQNCTISTTSTPPKHLHILLPTAKAPYNQQWSRVG